MMTEQQLRSERARMQALAEQMARDLAAIKQSALEVERSLMQQRGAIAMLDRLLVVESTNGAIEPNEVN